MKDNPFVPGSVGNSKALLAEVAALLHFASERAVDPTCEITGPLHLAAQNLETSLALGAAQESAGPGSQDSQSQDQSHAKLACQYSKLCKLTYPVTGRTLIQTEQFFYPTVFPLHSFALLFLLLTVGSEILKAWLGDQPEPEEGWVLWILNFQRYVLDYCSPFFWGALGSVTYLLKRLSDLAEDRIFDSASSHGWTTRILLGAILGGIVQYIYDPSVFVSAGAGFKMSANALGFLTGVGVKVVYGAIEKTIETLATKMNLDAIRTTKFETASVRTFLIKQLAKEDDPDKRRVLNDLIGDLQEPTK